MSDEGVVPSAGQQVQSGLRKAMKLILVVVVLAALGFGVLLFLAQRDLDKTMREIGSDPPAGVYPPQWVVCTGKVDERCAADAHVRAGQAVAWVPSTTDMTARLVVATVNGKEPPFSAFEEFGTSDDLLAALYTQPQDPPDGVDAGHLSVAGTRADIREDSDRSIDLYTFHADWTSNDVPYRLTTTGDRKAALDLLRSLAARVQYTSAASAPAAPG